jgi:hypothetical protein
METFLYIMLGSYITSLILFIVIVLYKYKNKN